MKCLIISFIVGHIIINLTLVDSINFFRYKSSKYGRGRPRLKKPTSCSDRDLFSCNDGKNCLEEDKVCDCVQDCPGGQDEAFCSQEQNNFHCESGDKCLPYQKRCDCFDDCADWSDEEGCPSSLICPFQCGNGRPYREEMRCDCKEDCADGADEKDCANDPSSKRFECASGNGCANLQQTCDGHDDCDDGSDEKLDVCTKEIECLLCKASSSSFGESFLEICLQEQQVRNSSKYRVGSVTCKGFCSERRTTYRVRGQIHTAFKRGCESLPVVGDLEEKCYDMKRSTDAEKFTQPGRKRPYNSRNTVLDQMRVCLSDNCNHEAVDLTRFCVDPEREQGVGKFAAAKGAKFEKLKSTASAAASVRCAPVVALLNMFLVLFICKRLVIFN